MPAFLKTTRIPRSAFILGSAALLLVLLSPARAANLLQVDDAWINGMPVRLVVDTGAGGGLILFRSAARRIGLHVDPPPRGQVPDAGQVELGQTEPCTVVISGRTIPNWSLQVYAVPRGIPSDCDGVLGWQVLKQGIWVLDVAEGRCAEMSSVPEESLDWDRLSVRRDVQTLCLEGGGTPGHRQILTVDTGDSDGVSLAPAVWDRWKRAHPNRPYTLDSFFMPGAGLMTSEISWANRLNLAGLDLTGIPVSRANIAQISASGYAPDFVGSLGLAGLERLHLVVDGPDGVAYARPRRRPPAPFQHNRLGAVFVPQNLRNDPLLAHVVPGGPASAAGVRDGDVLLRVGDLDVTRWRTLPGILPLSRFWNEPPGTKLVLTLRRGSSQIVIPVTLRDLIGPGALAG